MEARFSVHDQKGVKQAPNFKKYTFINRQTMVDEGPKSFVFQMSECRGQQSRFRKGLVTRVNQPVVLTTCFARGMDSRLKTEGRVPARCPFQRLVLCLAVYRGLNVDNTVA